MSEDITIERALIESLLGEVWTIEDTERRWYVKVGPGAYPKLAWSVPGIGGFGEFGPWRMYPNHTNLGVIGGFDNIIAKLRDPVFREQYKLPPLDDSE